MTVPAFGFGMRGPGEKQLELDRRLIDRRFLLLEEELGRVEEIRQTGGADLLVVRGGGRERLIPFARSICPRVAPAEGVIEIDPPEGLLELDEV